MIRLHMKNPPDNSLGCYLYADQGCLNAERQQWFSRNVVDWKAQVHAVQGNTVTLVRPLRLDVRLEWQPASGSIVPASRKSALNSSASSSPMCSMAVMTTGRGIMPFSCTTLSIAGYARSPLWMLIAASSLLAGGITRPRV